MEDAEWQTGDAVVVLRQTEVPDLLSTQDDGSRKRGRVLVDRGSARAGEAGSSSAVRAADSGRAVAAEPGGIAATGAFQQIERAGVGADDGVVRDAGGVLGPRVEPDGGGELLHPTRAGRQVRMDGAGREGVSDRGGQSDAACRRRFTGCVICRRRAGRWIRAGGNPG